MDTVDELTRLLLDAREGDRVALSAFVRRTQADVWRFCAHLVDPASADDLTQEVYLRATRTVGRFRADASARTWLLAIARNTCTDELRRRARRRRFVVSVHQPVDLPVEDPARAADLDALVHGLGPARREVFVLTQILGLTYREAAEILGVPVGTVRSRLARAREELVALLAEDPGAGEATGA
jgi:RNA polymerase sigma-70 factor, ECF subfamily